jgi:GT2 family glycosyltransferase
LDGVADGLPLITVLKPMASRALLSTGGLSTNPYRTDEHVAAWFHVGEDCPHTAAGAANAPEDHLVPGCTVAVCTYKRAESLKRFLESVERQERKPDHLLIVDASADDETERMLKGYSDLQRVAGCVLYCRVRGPLIGLTRQRNFSLRNVLTDLVAFFDDDIVLLPGCLAELERAHRSSEEIVGAGAFIGEFQPLYLAWRLRRLTGAVSTLQPGKYCRSGMSIPWSFRRPAGEVVEGDYLAGGATMWKTAVAREIGFNETFAGYALGEDLDFSLRARNKGKLVLVDDGRVLHLHEQAGRPDYFRFGYMAISNHYDVHRRVLRDLTGRDKALFAYAWFIDTVLLSRRLRVPGRFRPTCHQIAGRLKAAWDLITGAARSGTLPSSRDAQSERKEGSLGRP